MNKPVLTSFTILCLLSIVFLMGLAFNIQIVKAGGTIYIRADGSIDPPTAPISSVDNITYTFTDNIYDEIVVERDNIVVKGAGHTVNRSGTGGNGIDLSRRQNVTIENMQIRVCMTGINLNMSTGNSISGNNLEDNFVNLLLRESSGNRISGNNITGLALGIGLIDSSDNILDGNDIRNTFDAGIYFRSSPNNTLTRNVVDNMWIGIDLDDASHNNLLYRNLISNTKFGISCDSDNTTLVDNTVLNNEEGFLSSGVNSIVYHNNFIDNVRHVGASASPNTWDNGYPSGGNYWSDHACVGNPSDGSQPYIIDADNIDHYPFQDPDGWMKVHNVDTGLDYETIQEAMNAPETSDGHTIYVDAGIYLENVVLNKSVSLVGENRGTTIVEAAHEEGHVVSIVRDNVSIMGFTIRGFRVFGQPFWTHYDGIYLNRTRHCSVTGNNITQNENGICLFASSSNSISENSIRGNTHVAIHLENSSNNTISENNITYNNYGLVLSRSSDNNNIGGNSITHAHSEGIAISRSDNNSIFRNNLIDNYEGIHLTDSSHNTLYGNNIMESKYGLWTSASSGNLIYHNNFINNSQQVHYPSINLWDNGYPSGGNYWSDYTGVDLYSGAYQNETGSDGLGDSPYVIDESNQDNYPLTSPFGSETQRMQASYRNLWLRNTQLLSDIAGLNSTLLDLHEAVSDLEEQINRLNSTLQSSTDLLNSTLVSKEEALINELSNIRNMMYIFIATTIFFIAATVYFVIIKPKVKA